jgi:hypothetical protein
MTSPQDGSTRITDSTSTAAERRPTGTSTGQDVTSRMTGTAPTADRTTTRAKTSAGATFALVFGLASLFCALTAILAPAAVLFGLIGLVLGVVGLKMAKRPHVTGRGVALGGLVTAVLGLLLGAGVMAGLAVAVNSESAIARISDSVESLRSGLPSEQQVEDRVEETVR